MSAATDNKLSNKNNALAVDEWDVDSFQEIKNIEGSVGTPTPSASQPCNTDMVDVAGKAKAPADSDFKKIPPSGPHSLDVDSVLNEENDWEIMSEAKSDWEIMSDVKSVHSLDSFHFSYKDAVMMRKLTPTSAERSIIKKHVQELTPRNPNSNINQEAEKEDYDSFFFRDGYKEGRGGKAAMKFNTNQPSPKDLPYTLKRRQAWERKVTRRRDRRELRKSTNPCHKMK